METSLRYNFIICVIQHKLLSLDHWVVSKHMGLRMEENQAELGSATNY